jgi:hypothetical protein
MRRKKMKPAEAARIREEWLGAIEALREQVKGWAEARGWQVDQSEREILEEDLGTYKVPVLQIAMPEGEVFLRPIGHDLLGGGGRVDLYAYPTLYRVMLLRKNDPSWVVLTDSGLKWPHPWSESTFVELAEGLIGAE